MLQVASDIGRHLDEPRIIINKSTVPVGTAQKVRATIQAELAARGVHVAFSVVSNPEFLKEGAAVSDFMKPDRIIVGTDDETVAQRMRDLYAPFNRNHDRVLVMDIPSAELTKYAANVLLATKISFMNELAGLAERLGADIEHVRIGIGSDPRIGFDFIYPGCGYGGSCFPKDVRALEHTARELGYDAPLIRAVESVNNAQKQVLERKLMAEFGADLQGRRIAIWGLAFKPNTDDMREAPSRTLIDALRRRGASIRAYDPVAMVEAKRIYAQMPEISFCDEPYAACDGADALMICTEWQIFRSPDFAELKRRLRHPLIIDGRNLYDPRLPKAAGLQYRAIGRP
nr:UDP-glucose/GDP-mannose dehydrogenase family protein [Acidithiobacillus sp. AMEEHan]